MVYIEEHKAEIINYTNEPTDDNDDRTYYFVTCACAWINN